MLSFCLLALYGLVLALALVLARSNRERPMVLTLTVPPALGSIYALSTRVYRLVTGERLAGVIYNDLGLVIYWAAIALVLAYALWLTRRYRACRGFVGPDGRRWRVRRAHVPGDGAVPVARPGGD